MNFEGIFYKYIKIINKLLVWNIVLEVNLRNYILVKLSKF